VNTQSDFASNGSKKSPPKAGFRFKSPGSPRPVSRRNFRTSRAAACDGLDAPLRVADVDAAAPRIERDVRPAFIKCYQIGIVGSAGESRASVDYILKKI
jgi:hypothetical protein